MWEKDRVNSYKRILFGVVGIIVLVFGVLFGVTHVDAKSSLSEEEQNMFSQNNILFYEPCLTQTSTASLGGDITIAGSTAEEKIWSGLASFLTPEQAAGILGNIGQEDGNYNPLRREVGQSGGLYNRGTQMGLGLVQWSFGRRVDLLNYIKKRDESLIKYFEDNSLAQMSGDDLIKKIGEDVVNKLYQLEIEYIKYEIDKGYKEYYKQTDIDAATVWFRSKYERAGVFNDGFRIQKAHKAYDKYAGKTIVGTADVSGEVGSGSGNPCDSKVEGSKNINGTAVALAWPLGTDKSVYRYAQSNGLTSTSAYNNISKWTGGKATDAFNDAFERVYPNHKKWSQCPSIGASCDVGVGTVVRYSGVDSNFPRGLGEQISYAKEHSDIWEIIDASGESPQPGDVVNNTVSGNHTYIIAQDENGEFYRVESGLCSNFFRVSRKFTKFESGAKILRAKNAKNSNVGVSVKNGVKSSSTTGTLTSGSGQGNGDINASAIELAWPEGEGNPSKSATSRFQEVFASLDGGPGGGCYINGKSCSVFVNTVLLYAGAQKGNKVKSPGRIADDMIDRPEEWEEVGNEETLKHSDLQGGEVIVYYRSSSNPGNESKHDYKGLHTGHIAIYVKTPEGKGKIAEASYCNFFGKINNVKEDSSIARGYAGARAFRWKKGTSSSCNLCGDGQELGEAQLKAGGMNLQEAKEFMKAYHDAAMGTYYKTHSSIEFQGAHIHDAGCPYGVMNNCVAFSQWFINKYTTVGPKWNNTTNGVGLVKSLAKTANLKTGTVPRPYAIFSNAQFSYAGHTGVILGVDQDAKKVVVGEASCSESAGYLYYEPQVKEYSFDYLKKNNWTFAYTDDVISMGGPLKDV